MEIFFVLSGFLIGGILFRDIDKNKGIFYTLKHFWIRRWMRILPLYYAVLLAKFIYSGHLVGANIWYYVFFLQNYFYGTEYFGISWSLVIEEWFYLFAPVIIYGSVKVFKESTKIALSLILFILFMIVSRFIYCQLYDATVMGLNGNALLRFDSLFWGVLLAFIAYKKQYIYLKLQKTYFFIFGIILAILYVWLYKLGYDQHLVDSVLWYKVFGFTVLPFSVFFIIPYMESVHLKDSSRFHARLIHKFVHTTSVLTYSMYLLHPFVYYFGFNVFVSIFFTYALSWPVYTYFEKPILQYRDTITGEARNG